ncbi:MAG TPA: thiamine-phosphate kinase [Tepidisphaeraceae bacterium]|nr:thiamine-phosphate kinase [Tepidisphaeraceae bacterium]
MGGEFDFLEWIRSRQKPDPLIVIGSGDDLAAYRWPAGELMLAGVDQVVDGVHFDSKIHPPRAIGRKAMNRNLSDCAAMACLPAAALATVALPAGCGLEYARELYLGMEEAANLFACPIVGGDTSSWPRKLVMTVTILGRDGGIPPITRGGARAGERIFVTGPLGGSLLGRHMEFEPRVRMGRELAEKYRPTAMIDLSDGLSRDLRHICRLSGVGAVIEAGSVPIHADAISLSARDARTPLEHALHDGEDYELLFTCAAEVPGAIRIGVTTTDREIVIRDGNQTRALEPMAWEHRL